MPEKGFNFGSSILKRESKGTDQVIGELQGNGWRQTGSLGNRVFYLENSGMSITVVEGAIGTLVLPSGPVRGRLFGESGLRAGRSSLMGIDNSSSSGNSSSGDDGSSSGGEPSKTNSDGRQHV